MDIDQLISDLKSQLSTLLGDKYKELKPELQQDINTFLEKSKKKLERWVLLLATSSISQEEFEWLLRSQQDLIVLQALQAAGVSKIRLNNIKNNIIETVLQVIVKVITISV